MLKLKVFPFFSAAPIAAFGPQCAIVVCVRVCVYVRARVSRSYVPAGGNSFLSLCICRGLGAAQRNSCVCERVCGSHISTGGISFLSLCTCRGLGAAQRNSCVCACVSACMCHLILLADVINRTSGYKYKYFPL